MVSKKLSLAFMVFGTFISTSAYSSICDVVIKEQAYDVEKSNVASSVMFAEQEEICSKQYTDSGHATSTARSGGFGITFKKFGANGSSARQNSNGTWDIREEEFCRASGKNLKSFYIDDSESVIANIAVNAWRECVKDAKVNKLFMEYKVSPKGDYFRGTLRITAETGSLNRDVTGISVNDSARDYVKCDIGGKTFTPDEILDAPVKVETTGTAVVCEKTKDVDVTIAIQTSESNVPFVDLPSSESIEDDRIDDLARRIKNMELEVIEQSLSRLEENIKTGKVQKEILQRIAEVNHVVHTDETDKNITEDIYKRIESEQIHIDEDINIWEEQLGMRE